MTDHNLDIDSFLATLKIHNKDIDACFNDAVAVRHLQTLINNKVIEVLEELNTGAVGTNCCSTHIQLVNKLSELKQQANLKELENE